MSGVLAAPAAPAVAMTAVAASSVSVVRPDAHMLACFDIMVSSNSPTQVVDKVEVASPGLIRPGKEAVMAVSPARRRVSSDA